MRWLVIGLVLLAFILVPFVLFESQFNQLSEYIARGGAPRWGVVLGIVALLASDVVLPIPSSIVSATAGALLGFGSGTFVVWLGMSASCVIGYVIGARSSTLARRFVGEASLARASSLANRFGDFTIVICRPIPVLAEASVIAAGLFQTSFARVMLLSVAANLGVAAGYAAIGAYSMTTDSFLVAFLGALVVPGIAMLVGKMWLSGRKP
jgi:uncharacterized membrane protein YdjX (TVP38/TMEM64 family)